MKKGVWIGILIVLSLLLFGANYGGNFVFLLGTDAVSLLPSNQNDSHSEMVSRHIFEGLVEFNERMEIVPCLAERWDLSEDGIVYTFFLREGIQFHDGSPFNAGAVKRYFDFMIQGTMRRSSFLRPYIQKIEEVSDLVVRFYLNFPFGAFLNYLAHTASLIPSPKSIEQWGSDVGQLGRNPVGTGPFVFEEWNPSQSIRMVANIAYWKGRPFLDQIEFRIIPEDVTRIMLLQSGQAHLTTNVPPIMQKRLEGDSTLRLRIEPTIRCIYLGFNTQKPPFDDLRVRKAINHAVDKERLTRIVLRGMAQPADSVVAPLTMGYSSIGSYAYDPDLARQLLADAGYAVGLQIELAAPQGRYMQDYETAIAVQAMLAEVNIDVDLQTMEWARYTSYIFGDPEHTDYDMFLHGWAPSTGEAGWVIYPLFFSTNLPPSGDNATFFQNRELDELIELAMRTIEPEVSNEVYRQAFQLIMDQAPWVFLFHLKQLVVHTKNVEGVEVLPIDIVLVKNAWFQ